MGARETSTAKTSIGNSSLPGSDRSPSRRKFSRQPDPARDHDNAAELPPPIGVSDGSVGVFKFLKKIENRPGGGDVEVTKEVRTVQNLLDAVQDDSDAVSVMYSRLWSIGSGENVARIPHAGACSISSKRPALTRQHPNPRSFGNEQTSFHPRSSSVP